MPEPFDIAGWLSDHAITRVRVEATNLDGTLLGKYVSVPKFVSGLTSGFSFADHAAFGLDLGNESYFGFALPSWRHNLNDIFLRVDPTTARVWQPGVASVVGSFHDARGEHLSACPRNALVAATERARQLGFSVKTAVEIEATVFEESIHEARKKNYRDLSPLGGRAGACYVLAKSKDWTNYMSAVADRLDDVGIAWEAFNDEAASGQVELNIAVDDPLIVADNWARARQVMREVAFDQGRSVSFMPKWCDEFGQAAHLNVSLQREGANAFYAADGPSTVMQQFLGGVMSSIKGATSLALPWITSYRRLAELEGPPTTATWGMDNKTVAVRAVVGHPSYSRIEYRVPGSDANVYLVLAALIGVGLAGVEQELTPPVPTTDMAWGTPQYIDRLPNTITKAADALAEDKLLLSALGSELVDYWIGTRRSEWLAFHANGGETDDALTEWESTRYFELV
ncbi:glutamine synthetase family protein [Mycolicibacterium sp.]|uniref:glutamine synthetase family protein n=1 Tax=Mycolicibacterium sp. TaxID=2320850 RepID=UPI0037C5AD9A